MTGHGRGTGRPVGTSRRYRDRLVVGTPTEVGNVVRSTMERGRLVAVTVPRDVGGGKVAVTIRTRAPAPTRVPNRAVAAPAPPVRRRRRTVSRATRITAVATGLVATVAVAGYAAFLLIKTTWPVLVALAVVTFWLRRKLRRASH